MFEAERLLATRLLAVVGSPILRRWVAFNLDKQVHFLSIMTDLFRDFVLLIACYQDIINRMTWES